MKTRTSLLAMGLLMPVALLAANFEGTVTMNMTASRGQTMPVTFSVKPGYTRMDMQAGGQTMSQIMDQSKQEVIMLMPQQKMYMVHPMPKAQAETTEGTPASDVKFEKTNEHEKILGYDTTKYLVTAKGTTSQVWLAEGIGTFMGMGSQGGPMPGRRGGAPSPAGQAWEEALRGKEVFPLRVTVVSDAGKETFKMEATSIEKKSLPDSLFQPPADFQKFDMGAMMQGGMRGLMPGMKRPPQSGNGE